MTALQPIQRAAWREEFVTGATYIEAAQMRARLLHGIEAWPRELSKPIAKRFGDAFRAMPKPVSGGVGLQPLREVLNWADDIKRELSSLKLAMVSGDAELCELAERCARMCSDYPDAAEWIVARVGLDQPNGRTMTEEGKQLRRQCMRWWRRSLRRHIGQEVENAMRSRGFVRKGKAAYCTDWALRRRTSQRLRTETILKAAIAENELGEQLSLFDAAQASVSNPVNRRNELMTRIRGFEELATEQGHVALFGTLTAPSCYHAQHASGGENELFKTAGRPTVARAQQWLCRMWARARAKLARLSIALYGFRIAEPHHDGTPHWHVLFFLPAHQADTLRKVVGDVWLSEHADEKGAAKYRTQFKKINPALGDAAGYVAKYVAKNIDGFNVGQDYEAGGEAGTTAHRVDAWASTHRIRQFQQVGGARVGVWREVRRIRDAECMGSIQEARDCADDVDWCGFSKAAQGIELWKEQTGECNQYREAKAPGVVGVQSGAAQVRTRLHKWFVQWSHHEKDALSVVAVQESLVQGEFDKSNVGCVELAPSTGSSASKAPRDDSAPAGLPPLGPVSITVRSQDQRPRSDGRMLYQHAGRWRIHQAFNVARDGPPPLPRGTVLFTYDYKQFCEVRPCR